MLVVYDVSIYIERVLHETFLCPIMYRPKIGMMKARKLGITSKIFLFSKALQDYGNISADFCLIMMAVGQAGILSFLCEYSNLQGRCRFCLSMDLQVFNFYFITFHSMS